MEREGGGGGGRGTGTETERRATRSVGRSIGRLLVGAVKSVACGMFYVGQLDVPTAFPLYICIDALVRVRVNR